MKEKVSAYLDEGRARRDRAASLQYVVVTRYTVALWRCPSSIVR